VDQQYLRATVGIKGTLRKHRLLNGSVCCFVKLDPGIYCVTKKIVTDVTKECKPVVATT
jgi:hypothetical protein